MVVLLVLLLMILAPKEEIIEKAPFSWPQQMADGP